MTQKSFTVLPFMCKQQKEEIDQLLSAADEIGAAAVSVAAQGGQGYNSLLECRDRFKRMLLSFSDHYRVCFEVDESNASIFSKDSLI